MHQNGTHLVSLVDSLLILVKKPQQENCWEALMDLLSRDTALSIPFEQDHDVIHLLSW